MTLLTLIEPVVVNFTKSSGSLMQTFEAGKPYLVADAQINRIMSNEAVSSRAYRISKAEMRIQNAHISAMKEGDNICLYNGGGGYGDSICTFPVAKILADRGLNVHVLADPGNTICWWGLDFVKTVQTIPLLWETVKLFKHFACFEAPVNQDEHPDQEHPVDAMLRKIGIDPRSVPDADKCVRPRFVHSELGTLQKYLQLGKKIGLYQLSSANPLRGLTVNDSVYLATKLATEFPDTHWLCLHDQFVPVEYKDTLASEAAKAKLTNIEAFTSPNLRELWALTEHVSVVVSPDSMMSHVAGVFSTPCVGLWGPVDPSRRVRYYKNHHAIWNRAACPHAPCFAYGATIPRYCPAHSIKRTTCDIISSVSPKDVTDLVRKVRR